MSTTLFAQDSITDSVSTHDSNLQKPSFRLLVDGGRVWTPIAPEDTTQLFRFGISLGVAPKGGLDFVNRISTAQNQSVLLPLTAGFQAGIRISPHWEVDIRMPIDADGYDPGATLRLHDALIPKNPPNQDIKVKQKGLFAGSIMAGFRYSSAPYNRSGFMWSFGGGAMVVYRGGYTIVSPTAEILTMPEQIKVHPTFYFVPQYRLRFSNHFSATMEFLGIQFVSAGSLRLHSLSVYHFTLSYHF